MGESGGESSKRGILHRLAAFSTDPGGGNPAGVWIGAELPPPVDMLSIAAAVGYSETAFLGSQRGNRYLTRYYSPEAEVSFCGHATIASGVVLGDTAGLGTYYLDTAIGEVAVEVSSVGGVTRAALTSVEPSHELPPPGLVDGALAALRWERSELDDGLDPAVGYAGARHLILAANTKARLDSLEYDFERLKTLMLDHDLTTVQLLWREGPRLFHSRNPFPIGGVVEDPATGAAAAAMGGYLRDSGRLDPPATIAIRQGEVMGRPSLLTVDIPISGGIVVSGPAVAIDG